MPESHIAVHLPGRRAHNVVFPEGGLEVINSIPRKKIERNALKGKSGTQPNIHAPSTTTTTNTTTTPKATSLNQSLSIAARGTHSTTQTSFPKVGKLRLCVAKHQMQKKESTHSKKLDRGLRNPSQPSNCGRSFWPVA